MKFFENIYTSIKNLSEKDFLKYMYIMVGIILLVSSFFMYRYFSSVNSLKKELRRINSSREEVQSILSRDNLVKKQKEIVNELINKNRNFKLIQYFDSVMQNLGLSNNVKDRDITVNDTETLTAQGYAEVKLNINLTSMNMKQLVELLDEFEKNERIYIKSLDITKSENSPTIDVNIVIATIQPKEEITEITE